MQSVKHAPLSEWLKTTTQDFVKIGFTDIDGVLRCKYLSRKKLIAASTTSVGWCDVVFKWDSQDVVYDRFSQRAGFGDAPARVVSASRRRLPWEDDLPFLLVDFHPEQSAEPSVPCPRSVLRRVVEKAEQMGFSPRFGPEFEWFVYRESPASLHEKRHEDLSPLTPGMFGYSGTRTGQYAAYHRDLLTQLAAHGVDLEGLHTETGPGAMEAAIAHRPALEAADRAVLFKEGVRQISFRHGLLSSFMAKPRADLPGCGGHLHQSLWRGGRNVFSDPTAAHGMSKLFRHYLAGQLFLLPALMPLYAPNVNSYKRFVPGSWAATRANWGVDNRTVALRVILGGEKSTRLETRVPGADANPYLSIAAALASGLYGIENELELSDPPVTGSAYAGETGPLLARDLGAAAGAELGGEALAHLIAPAFSAHFLQTRRWEWQQYHRAVTDWERRRYFELA